MCKSIALDSALVFAWGFKEAGKRIWHVLEVRLLTDLLTDRYAS